MRVSKTFSIGKIDVTLSEITVQMVCDLTGKITELKDVSMTDTIDELLPQLSNLTVDNIKGFSFSEIEELIAALKEVNAPFLRTVESVLPADFLKGILAGLREQLMQRIVTGVS